MTPPNRVPATPPAPAAPPPSPEAPRRRLRWLPVILILLLLAVLSLAEPRVFQFAVGKSVQLVAWRAGADVNISAVEGSLWQPVALLDSRWTYETSSGSMLRVDIERAEGVFYWKDVLTRTGRRWFRQLRIEGVVGKLECPTGETTSEPATRSEQRERERSWDWLPERVEIRNVNFLAVADQDSVRVVNGNCLLSTVDQGQISAEQLVVKQPWLSHTFRDVKGTSALQGSQVILAEVELGKGIMVRSFAAKLPDLAEGRIDAKAEIAAFGGALRVQAETLRRDGEPGLEISVHPVNIAIAELADFLKLSEAAGGTIKTGRFTFRGSPANFPKATATLRLEATNFQWESRQWNSLVLGATLLNRRLSIPELALHQGANRLNLNGELQLPKAGQSWRTSDFSLNITARLENLTELSALMLPEFRYVAGKMNIDGSVQGKDQKFTGALILSGNGITWRNAPIEELHAAVRLNGNEMQVVNLEFLNQNDFIRGRGAVNILGKAQYWGEVKANIQELAKYAAILQPPLVPEPLAGGGSINWSGKGFENDHSGSFSARLQQLRTLGDMSAMLHPLSAMLDGSYGEGWIDFSRFSLADEESAFSTKATVRDKALTLTEVRLTHGDAVWLEGSATLPLDIRRVWPSTSLPELLTDGVPSKVDLVAKDLQLRGASRLTGWKWPIEGVLNGEVKAEGPIGALQSSGKVQLTGGRIPLGGDDHLADVDAEISLTGQTLTVDAFQARHASGNYSASGEIDFTNIRDTGLALAVRSPDFTYRPFPGLPLDASLALELEIKGPASAAMVGGKAMVTALRMDSGQSAHESAPQLGLLWSGSPNAPLPALRRYTNTPYVNWTLDVSTDPEHRTQIRDDAEIRADLRLTGSGAAPVLCGAVELAGTVAIGNAAVTIDAARMSFREGSQSDPAVELLGRGEVAGEPFFTMITGTLTHPIRVVNAATPALTELAAAALAGEHRPPTTFAMDRNLPTLLQVDVQPWPAIELPPPAPEPVEPPVVTETAVPAEEPAPTDAPAPEPTTPPAAPL